MAGSYEPEFEEDHAFLFAMKRYYTFLLMLWSIYAGISQTNPPLPRYDNVWLFGYESFSSSEILGGTRITFDTYPPTIVRDDREMDFEGTNSSMSDKNGNLIFYTNGYYIANTLSDTMDGGERINPDPTAKQDRNTQGTLVLPKPNNDNIYYIIHEQSTWAPTTGSYHQVYSCLYSIVDMRLNNGLGKVVEANKLLIKDTLCYGKLTACKHANGRDWWLLIPKWNSATYFRFLLSAEGLSYIGQQNLGPPPFSNLGQAVFSPDGTKYIKLNTPGTPGMWLDIYNFDRCTGMLSDYRSIFKKPGGAPGVGISPNSRCLYLSQGIELYQYDLEAPDVESTEVLLGDYDGYLSPLETYFFQLQLAPDGKLYMNSASSVNTLHVIHQPDLPGIACHFEQHGIQMPTLNAYSMPNFPYYRLGPLDGSPCDTLGLDNLPAAHFRWEFWDTLSPLHVFFTDLSVYEPAEWHWDFGDSAVSAEKSPEHTYSESGIYTVCLTVSNAYGADTTCYTLTVLNTSVRADPEPLAVSVVPNPFHSVLAFAVPVEPWQRVDAVLYDLTGRAVARTAWRGGHSDWHLESLPAGVYGYELRAEDGRRAVGKVAKM